MSRIHKKQKQLRYVAVILVIGLTLAMNAGLTTRIESTPWFWFVCYFISVNLVTWIVFYYDKRIAGRQTVRVPENVLFLLAVAGGLPSTLVAMQVLRHKRAKSAFKIKLFLWFAVVYSVLGAGYWFVQSGAFRSVS